MTTKRTKPSGNQDDFMGAVIVGVLLAAAAYGVYRLVNDHRGHSPMLTSGSESDYVQRLLAQGFDE